MPTHRFLFVAALLAPLICTSTFAASKEDCERPEFAQEFGASFQQSIMKSMEANKQHSAESAKKVDDLKAKLVAAGAWTEKEASSFVVRTSLEKDAVLIEGNRKKKANDLKVSLLAIEGVDLVTRGDKAAELRATCILGLGALDNSAALNEASAQAWSELESKILAFAKEKNISLP